MREELSKLAGQRIRVAGIVARYGIKPKFQPQPVVRTICLQDIADQNGNLLCDHLWFAVGNGFASLGELSPGQLIELDATVTQYQKRLYRGKHPAKSQPDDLRDFRLSWPRRIVVRG